MSMNKAIVPAQVAHWLKEMHDPATPLSLRRNYQQRLEELQRHIAAELMNFETTLPRPGKPGKVRAIRAFD